jgi:hypothetical protein
MDGDMGEAAQELREKHGATVYELDATDDAVGAWLDELRWKIGLVSFYQKQNKNEKLKIKNEKDKFSGCRGGPRALSSVSVL